MECPKCNTQNSDNAPVCSICGHRLVKKTDEDLVENKKLESILPDEPGEKKNYSPIFWKWFVIWVALNFIALTIDELEVDEEVITSADYLALGLFVALIIALILFCQTTQEALKKVGKNYGWALGLLALVPFGFWITFFLVRSMLIPAGYWISKHKSFKMTK